MKLWKIYRKNPINDDRGIYDTCMGFVISSNSEKDTIQIAVNNAADEGQTIWKDKQHIEVLLLSDDSYVTEAQILLRDFNAG